MRKVADAQECAKENQTHCKKYARKLKSQQVCVVNFSGTNNMWPLSK